jgi:hypothetical protein
VNKFQSPTERPQSIIFLTDIVNWKTVGILRVKQQSFIHQVHLFIGINLCLHLLVDFKTRLTELAKIVGLFHVLQVLAPT